MLSGISLPALQALDPKAQEASTDVVGRNQMIELMLLTPKGEYMLKEIAKAAGEEPVDFGERVRTAVVKMNEDEGDEWETDDGEEERGRRDE